MKELYDNNGLVEVYMKAEVLTLGERGCPRKKSRMLFSMPEHMFVSVSETGYQTHSDLIHLRM